MWPAETDDYGKACTKTGFARDPTGAVRCRLGSKVAVLAPKRAQ